ncbi:hypothetical protein [Arthrobacter sp. TWP1-1]|uniref:hypothetical protein n=1 Tax=Arthrobacter sp. TWP1-1 TaxID=2804568 RepID=UPI003CF3A6B0
MTLDPHKNSTHLFSAAGMDISIDSARQILTLATPDGASLARLRLLSSINTTAGTDEIRVTDVDVQTTDGNFTRLGITAESSIWQHHRTQLSVEGDALELTTTVQGAGRITSIQQLGAHVAGAGLLPSDLLHNSVFSPNPDRPWQILRPAGESAALGVVGDGGQPGVGRWLFTPPPLCLALSSATPETSPEATGRCLMIGVAAKRRPFTQLTYDAVTPGFSLRYDYDGHTSVEGQFSTPTLLLFLADNPYDGLKRYRELLDSRGLLPARTQAPPSPAWLEPMFCGWGAQNVDAMASIGGPGPAVNRARQGEYDGYLNTLETHGIVPGTIVIDDKWQQAYATCQPDTGKWPDLAGWIRKRQDAGQRVLLWYKAWDTEGAPPEACVLDHTGHPVALDPESPAGRKIIQQAARTMIGELGADGIKIDFTASTPAGSALTHAGPSWGIDLLHELLAVLYKAIKDINPDALVVTHTPDPGFQDVTDMLRLNDVLMLDQPGGHTEPLNTTPGTGVVDTMTHRALVAKAACPELPIDTDGWALPSQAAYQSWTSTQASFGVPSLYYTDRLDVMDPGEQPIPPSSLQATAEHWSAYRARLAVHTNSHGTPIGS